MLRKCLLKFGPNPLDWLLKRAKKRGATRFLLFWNRGLGDIPLGLYAIVKRIRAFVPNSEITFVTRPNLQEGFTLLGGVKVIVVPDLKRGDRVQIADLVDLDTYDVVLESPDPTQWVRWQRGTLIPKLIWKKEWDDLSKPFALDSKFSYVGAHVNTETSYASWRNWPVKSWRALFEKITASGRRVLLFGFEPDGEFAMPDVIDLRGKTPLFSLLALIKSHCSSLIVPDSGISSMVYYLNTPFVIRHISLWADPHMGILKQNVPSPNKQLQHIPLIGKDKKIESITPEQVYGVL